MAKATGIPLVDLGVAAMLGKKAKELALASYQWKKLEKVCVKGVVFPFGKFKEADSILGPEMKSTGETMGRGHDYAEALMKALIQCQGSIPDKGKIFVSLREKDKSESLPRLVQYFLSFIIISSESETAPITILAYSTPSSILIALSPSEAF